MFSISELLSNPRLKIYMIFNHIHKNINFIKKTRYSSEGLSKRVNIFRKFISKFGKIISKIFRKLLINIYTKNSQAIKTRLAL